MKQLLILAAIALIATILTACAEHETVVTSSGGIYGHIDTVVIHGKPHEFIKYRVDRGGSTTHSPECWCLKGDTLKSIKN